MAFLAPAFLIGAAAVAIPILLHLLRRQPEPHVPFSAVRFLRRAPVEHVQRRRLRELLLLALRVAALLLLAVSFARPYLRGDVAASGAPLTLVAIDTSYSMSAPGLFDRARQLARRALTSAPASHAVAVLAFDENATVAVRPSANRAAAVAAVDALGPGFRATSYRAALERAAELLAGCPGALWLVTDLQDIAWDRGTAAPGEAGLRIAFGDDVRIEIADVGAPAENLAVVSLARDGDRAVAGIRHTMRRESDPSDPRRARRGVAHLAIDGRPAGEAVFAVEADATTTVRFDAVLPSRGAAAVTVEDRIGYAADNSRYLALEADGAPRLLLVTSAGRADAFYVERAFEVDERARFQVEPVAASALARRGPDSLRSYAAILVLGGQGVDLKGAELLAEYVRAGGGLFVASSTGFEPALMQALFGTPRAGRPGAHPRLPLREAASDAKGDLRIVPADPRHPVFRAFGPLLPTLTEVRFQQVAELALRNGWDLLARFGDGRAALVEARVGEGRVMLFASDLSNRGNDLPLHPGFVPLLHETARYLGAGGEASSEMTVDQLPAGMEQRPGVVEIRTGHDKPGKGVRGDRTERRVVAVNVDLRESDPARLDPQWLKHSIPRSRRPVVVEEKTDVRRIEERQRLWQFGLALMLVAVAAEAAVARRTL